MGVPNQKGALAEGTVFGHYEIVRLLGSGGMGSVYEAIHTKLGKRVAIKTLLAHYASHPEAQTRFLREGKLAAKLRHAHVVDVTDFGIEDDVPYLVMEFLEGEDLSGLLGRSGRLFPQQIADLLIPVTAGLASAHDQQIVHRDLKPQNIFLARSSSGEVVPKVLDFGISKLLNDTEGAQLTGSMNLLGTPAYMSPEQARSGKNVDARSDQYTLALIVYQCVTGKMPFASEGVYELMRQIVEGEFQRPTELVEGLPQEFEDLILRGMANKADDRFDRTWEFGAALLPFASLRTRVMWETEFEGKSSTFVARVDAPRTASSPQMAALNTGALQAQQMPREPSRADSLKRGGSERTPAVSTALLDATHGGDPDRCLNDPSLDAPLSSRPTQLGASLGPQGSASSPAQRVAPSRSSMPAAPAALPLADEPEASGPLDPPTALRRTGAMIAAGVALLTLGGGTLWWFLGGSSSPVTPTQTVVFQVAPAASRVKAPTPVAAFPKPPPAPAPPVPIPVAERAPAPPAEAVGRHPPEHPNPLKPTAAINSNSTPAKAQPAKRTHASLGVLAVDELQKDITQPVGHLVLGTFGEFRVDLSYSVEGGSLKAQLDTEPKAKVAVNEGAHGSTKEHPYVLPPVGGVPLRIELQHGDNPPIRLVLTFAGHSP